jgi:hypothetical protein
VVVHSFSLPYTPACMAAVPNTAWVYVIDTTNTLIHLWSVDPSTAVWSESEYTTSLNPNNTFLIGPPSCFVSTSAEFLYVAFYYISQGGTIYSYPTVLVMSVDTESGSLSFFSAMYGSSSHKNRDFLSIFDNGDQTAVSLSAGDNYIDLDLFNGTGMTGSELSIYLTPNYCPSVVIFNDMVYSLFHTVSGPAALQTYTLQLQGTQLLFLVPSYSQISTTSQLFISNEVMYVVGLGVLQTLNLSETGVVSPFAFSSSPTFNTSTTQCLPVYSPLYGWIYNAVNGTNILQYNSSGLSLTPESVPIPGPPIPSSASCQLLMLASDTLVALTSSDRATVTTWKIS